MTQEKLEALKKLDADISYAESILTELKYAEGLRICGYDNSEVRTKYLIDTLGEDADLRTLITKCYEDKLAKLRKEFEEA